MQDARNPLNACTFNISLTVGDLMTAEANILSASPTSQQAQSAVAGKNPDTRGMYRTFMNRHQRNSSRVHLERFLKRAAASIPPGALVLDAGAGEAPYKSLFEHAKYESADFCELKD